jgi:hypothetical protein
MLPDSIKITITSCYYKVNDSKTVTGCWMSTPGRWFLEASLLLGNGWNWNNGTMECRRSAFGGMEYWDHWCSIWLKNNTVHRNSETLTPPGFANTCLDKILSQQSPAGPSSTAHTNRIQPGPKTVARQSEPPKFNPSLQKGPNIRYGGQYPSVVTFEL